MIHTVTVSLETLVWCISSQSRRLLSYVNTAEAVIVTGTIMGYRACKPVSESILIVGFNQVYMPRLNFS